MATFTIAPALLKLVYLLVNNPVFQLEPYGLSHVYMTLCAKVFCAVGCCEITHGKFFCSRLAFGCFQNLGELGALL